MEKDIRRDIAKKMIDLEKKIKADIALQETLFKQIGEVTVRIDSEEKKLKRLSEEYWKAAGKHLDSESGEDER